MRGIPSGGSPPAVLMISPQFRPIVGGYERSAERLSASLAASGWRVVVVTERRDRAWPAKENLTGFEVRRLFCSFRPHRHMISSLLSLAWFLLRNGRSFDVWHVHQIGFHTALAVILGDVLRRPVVVKLASAPSSDADKGAQPGVALFVRRVSACIATSDEAWDAALGLGVPRQRIHRIPNGVDGQQFRPASPVEREEARRALGVGTERMVLYVGRLSAEKNPLGLLDAWATLGQEARKGAVLWIVGDGPQRGAVVTKAKESCPAGSVRVVGARDDVALWYRAADLLVLPSLFEGLSNTMLEALASGLAIISSRVSGSSILVEPPSAGVLVDPGDVDALSFALRRLLEDDRERECLAQNARQKHEERFTLAGASKQHIALYEMLVSRMRKPAGATDLRTDDVAR